MLLQRSSARSRCVEAGRSCSFCLFRALRWPIPAQATETFVLMPFDNHDVTQRAVPSGSLSAQVEGDKSPAGAPDIGPEARAPSVHRGTESLQPAPRPLQAGPTGCRPAHRPRRIWHSLRCGDLPGIRSTRPVAAPGAFWHSDRSILDHFQRLFSFTCVAECVVSRWGAFGAKKSRDGARWDPRRAPTQLYHGGSTSVEAPLRFTVMFAR